MKKTISILICIMLLVGLMAGCGSSEKTAAPAETKIEKKAEEPAKKEEAPKKEEAKPVKLKLMMNSPENTEAYNDMAKEYNKQFLNVTLDMTIIQNDYQTVLKAKLNSGDIPDMFMSSAYADNVLFKDYSYDLTNEGFIKQIDPTFLNGVTLDGKVIGYPFLVQAHSYIY
ncbi:MAG: extracellular solute-binding protein, partial [Clostridia bacterium]|nr:extracellular solute-binding protein [Clostridia bacterium]